MLLLFFVSNKKCVWLKLSWQKAAKLTLQFASFDAIDRESPKKEAF